MDVASLRVYSAHYVFDQAVLSSGVHTLDAHQQGVLVGRPQQVLRFREPLQVPGKATIGFVLALSRPGPGGIVIGEAHSLARFHSKHFHGNMSLLDKVRDRQGAVADKCRNGQGMALPDKTFAYFFRLDLTVGLVGRCFRAAELSMMISGSSVTAPTVAVYLKVRFGPVAVRIFSKGVAWS
jgi:hypothetical protein